MGLIMNANRPEDFEGNVAELSDEALHMMASVLEHEIIRRRSEDLLQKAPVRYSRRVEFGVYKSPNTNRPLVNKMDETWDVRVW